MNPTLIQRGLIVAVLIVFGAAGAGAAVAHRQAFHPPQAPGAIVVVGTASVSLRPVQLGSFPVLPVCKAPTETTTLPHKITATGCVVNNHITVPPIGCSHGEPIVAVDPFASPAVQFKSAPMVVQLLVYDRFDASNDSYVSSHPKRFATGTRKPLRVRMPLRLVKGKIVRLVVEYYLPYPDGRKIPPSFNLAHEYQAYSAYTFCTN